MSSSEESRHKSKSKRHRAFKDENQIKSSKPEEGDGSGDSSTTSEIADFSSGNSDDGEDGGAGGFTIKGFNGSPSASPSLSSSSNDLEETYISAKRQAVEDEALLLGATERNREADVAAEFESWTRHRMPAEAGATKVTPAPWPRSRIRAKDEKAKLDGRTPILNVGSDIMAHVLTFLHPPEILNVLTMPLSKNWRQNFTLQPELWRVLCLVEPFKARIEDDDDDDTSSTDSFCSLNQNDDNGTEKRLLDRYRLLYTSFVRCMKYLSQIREDAVNGRPPTYIDYGVAGPNGDAQSLVGTNKSLQSFLARARGVVSKSLLGSESDDSSGSSDQGSEQDSQTQNALAAVARPGKVRIQTSSAELSHDGSNVVIVSHHLCYRESAVERARRRRSDQNLVLP